MATGVYKEARKDMHKMSFRVHRTLYEQCLEISRKTGVTMAGIYAIALAEYLDRRRD